MVVSREKPFGQSHIRVDSTLRNTYETTKGVGPSDNKQLVQKPV